MTSISVPRQLWSFKFMLGIRMMSQGRVDNAITAFEDAREIARGVKDPVLVAQATQLAAFTQILRGEMKSAEAMLVALPTDGMQPDQRAGVLGGLASLAAARDETAEAQKIIDEAAAVATPAGKPQIELLRINILNDEEKYVEAAKRARALIASSQGFAAPARFQLAEALLGNKAWDEARLVIDEIEKTQYKGEFTGEMQMATFKARLDAVKGDVAEARRELAEIAAKADDNGARLLALGARHELAKVELEHGDRQKAHALFAGLARDAAAMGCTRLARQARERMN